MSNLKVCIVGGVAGGASAAARLRRLNEEADITIYERSGYISYANCGLPYYIGGVIQEESALTLQTPQSFSKRFHVQVKVLHEVTAIDPKNKTIRVHPLQGGEDFTDTYDKLILSPGARPFIPALPGIDSPQIFTLRTVEDTLHINSWIQQNQPRSAVVVGGGFIGLEMAENLKRQGLAVTIVEQASHLLPPLDCDMACMVHDYLRQQGLTLKLGASVSGFAQHEKGLAISLSDGSRLSSDMVVLSAGVQPENGLAKSAGLKLGIKGSILVNANMQTSDPDIYAVGDAVEVLNPVTNQPAYVPLAGPANKQGRIAAGHIVGINNGYQGSLGASVVGLFGMTVAAVGVNESAAQRAGLSYDKVVTFSPHHATYYPGANNMTIKTLYSPDTGAILGAQLVGFDGVDKRCDILATAIRHHLTGADLAELELCYAPPYSSAKDPVNMAGFVIENIRSGLVRQYHWDDIPQLNGDNTVIQLDVRTPAEYAAGHIPGAISIPLDSLRERLDELDPKKSIYVNCQSGLRSYIACRILSQHGFTCYNLSGGYRFYQIVTKENEFDSAAAHPCGVKL